VYFNTISLEQYNKSNVNKCWSWSAKQDIWNGYWRSKASNKT